MFQITTYSLSGASECTYQVKKKDWNNKYDIYVIFHGVAAERETPYGRGYENTSTNVGKSGYEYIINRMQIIELKMRLNIQFDSVMHTDPVK